MTDKDSEVSKVVPTGQLQTFTIDDIIPSKQNPRRLFDEEQIGPLRENIKQHGVLVPITVYRPKGQTKFSILDGERRYRCCADLKKSGHEVNIPANIVNPPDKVAGILYMFSIHNLREQWELMPTALGLKVVMEKLGETDNKILSRLTSLSDPQIERCKLLLQFPEKYQNMSLETDTSKRVPSNFWIELFPVLELCVTELSEFTLKQGGRDGVTDKLVAKYWAHKIKSVIHFRRIMEAHEISDDKKEVLKTLKDYITKPNLETREAFDRFTADPRRIQGAIEACSDFVKQIKKLKIDYTLDRDELRDALKSVRDFANSMLVKLEGSDPPVERY